ncbi:MAG TPA: hypothetical protein VG713_01995 [Pirellulales bacterium]|nr:hypothetical protein [Pirellulales bacterium]
MSDHPARGQSSDWHRGDGAHRSRRVGDAPSDDRARPNARHAAFPDEPLNPSEALGRHCPRAIEKLELLDDTVFEAIAGKPEALEQLRALWPALIAEVGAELIAESRAQYLRHAMHVWRGCTEGDEVRNPRLAINAMEVIGLLLGE